MKLSQVDYQLDTPQQVEIKDHLGRSFEPKALISVIAWKSKQGSKALIEMQREMMKLNAEYKDGEDIESKVRDLAIEGLSKLIQGWEGIEDEKGKPLKFTPENAKKVLENQYIRDIVDSFCSNMGNFLKA